MGQRPTSPSQGQPGALTRGGARPGRAVGAAPASRVSCGTRACACAATASGSGARRRDEAKPKWGRGGVHGDAKVAASLIGGDAGEERRQGGGATALGGCGRRRLPAA